MRNRRPTAALSLLAGVAACFAVAAPAQATPSRSSVTLASSASPAAARSPRVGSVPATAAIDFAVNLTLPDQSAAAAFARSVSTPGSANYRKFLTPAQWEARFSPSVASVAKVTAFLRQSGFTVGQASADRMSVPASGTAQQVQRAFGTSLSYHKVNGATLRLADRSLSVPASVAGIVGGVSGVSQTLARPNSTTGSAAKPAAASADAQQPAGFRVAPPCGSYYNQKLDTTLPPYGNGYPANPPWAVCGYTGPQFRSAYGLTGATDGTGVTVAIVDAYASPTLGSDARQFASINDSGHPLKQSQFSELLSPTFNDQSLCDNLGWYGEQTLDVEAVHNTAPGAHILFAGARNCETGGLNDSLRAIVDRHLASIVTNSYGDDAGDVFDSAGDRQSTDDILMMAASTGVSVLFSSGDDGDEFTTVGQVAADYPASSPWATAVGGTSLQIGAGGSRKGEFGWSTARSFLCNTTLVMEGGCAASQLNTWLPIDLALDGGSGGGTSVIYPQPSYQQGVVPMSLSKRNGATPMRVEPDISMEADPATGMLVGETQQFPDGTYYDQYRIGGTSVASPLMAGTLARADEAAGTSLGFVNPALYALNGNSQALNDILPAGKQDQSRADFANSIDPSQGYLFTTRIIDYEGTEQFCNSQGSCKSRQVALKTAPGYDNMTGLGSPGLGFVQALSH